MQTPLRTLLALFATALAASAAQPSSAIVVDLEKQVWLADTGVGIWRLSGRGEATLQSKQSAQWLGLDADGRYAHSKPDRYQRITHKGETPVLLGSITGPIAIGPEGEVYYAASMMAT